MYEIDYFVNVFKILSYYYKTLKEGRRIIPEFLLYSEDMLPINHDYWRYIFNWLDRDGLLELPTPIGNHTRDRLLAILDVAQITPTGIDYLLNDKNMKEAAEYVTDWSYLK